VGKSKAQFYRQMYAVYMPFRLIYAVYMPFIQRPAVFGIFTGLMPDVTVMQSNISAQSLCLHRLICTIIACAAFQPNCFSLAVSVQLQCSAAVGVNRMTVYLFRAVYSAMKH